MKFIGFFSILLASAALIGCATPSVPLKPSSYEKSVSVTSNKTARIALLSGVVSGAGDMSIVPVGNGMYMPLSSGPYPHLQFNEDDQRTFIKAFRKELERLHLFKTALPDLDLKQPIDVEIKVLFAQTFHNPNHQEYTLDVAMQIISGEKEFTNRYRIISNEGDSWWEKMTTNASEGKEKAGKKLMNVLVTDVEKWLANQ